MSGIAVARSKSVPVRARAEGRLLPSWADTRDAEALRGTRTLRTVDPNLIVALDRTRHVYQIWGPSLMHRGWIPIVDCQDDDGQFYRSPLPWHFICAALVNAREGELTPDRVHRENEAREAQEAAAWDRESREAARYWRRAIQGELRGYGQHDGVDVAVGWRALTVGNSKRTPEERGQLISLPGPGGG